MPKAKKIASGGWTCRVYDHTEYVDGKKKVIQKRFTVRDPSPAGRRTCEKMAADWAAKWERDNAVLTVGEAIRRCLESKKDVLSPTTYRAYLSYQKNAYEGIEGVDIDKLTQEKVQRWIDSFSRDHSPKTCRNAHGFLVTCVTMFRPDRVFRTKLPQAKPPEYYTPSSEDIAKLLRAIKGTELEKAVLLAAFGTLRAGEICALTSDDIKGNVITVSKSLAKDVGGGLVVKQPKNASSIRYVEYPPEVIRKFDGINGRLVNLNPCNLSRSLQLVLKAEGLPIFRFHDLRAYSASIMHALGIPDVYIMKRGGWKTDSTLKKVYRRAIDEEEQRNTDRVNGYFSEVINAQASHKASHENKKAP